VPPPEVKKIEATPEAVAQANKELAAAAARARKMRASLTFDEFKATVYKEPFEGGKYIRQRRHGDSQRQTTARVL
jgi:hypothetical protein